MKIVAYTACFLAGCAFTGSAAAITSMGPRGSFSVTFNDLKYDPSTACYKPPKPMYDNEYVREEYKSEIRTYMSCIQDAANSDLAYAHDVIQEGYDNAVRTATGY